MPNQKDHEPENWEEAVKGAADLYVATQAICFVVLLLVACVFWLFGCSSEPFQAGAASAAVTPPPLRDGGGGDSGRETGSPAASRTPDGAAVKAPSDSGEAEDAAPRERGHGGAAPADAGSRLECVPCVPAPPGASCCWERVWR